MHPFRTKTYTGQCCWWTKETMDVEQLEKASVDFKTNVMKKHLYSHEDKAKKFIVDESAQKFQFSFSTILNMMDSSAL